MADNKFEGVKIGGLYKNKRQKDGKTYLTGKFGYGARMLVLPNPEKVEGAAANIPDFNIFIVEDKPKPATPTRSAPESEEDGL